MPRPKQALPNDLSRFRWATFLFTADLKAIMKWTWDHSPWRKPYHEETTDTPLLWIVKDEGLYLMSGSVEKPTKDGSRGTLVEYAVGMNPKLQDRGLVWDRCRDICGGDDFGEAIELKTISDILKTGHGSFRVGFTDTEMMVATKGEPNA